MANNFLSSFGTNPSTVTLATTNPVAAPLGGLFGNPGNAPASGPGLFGASSTAHNPPSSSLFNFPKPEEKKTLPGSAFPSGGLFGTSTTLTTAATTSSAQPGPLFGSGAPPAKIEAPRPQTTLAFGISTTTQSTFSGSLFPQSSTGAPRPQGSLFGQTTTAATAAATASATVAVTAAATTAAAPSATTTAASSSVQGGLLSQLSSSQPQTTSAPVTQGLFARPPTSAPSTQPGSSQVLFPGLSTSAEATGGLLSKPATTGAPTGLFGSLPSQSAAGGLFAGGSKPEEKKVEEKKNEYVPLQSLEEIKTAALSTKSLDDVLNKWRGTLISLSSDFKQTAYEVKQREICLYQTIEQIKNVLQMNDNISKEFEQQKQQLETISKEQVSLL